MPRLRDGKRTPREPFPLNEIPNTVIKKIGRFITGLLAVGRKDLTGDDWGDAWSYAVDGEHLARPLGLVDVVHGQMGWSTKTVKNLSKPGPHAVASVRLISGRNSPDYSWGITDPHADLQATGNAVLDIWNERVSIAEDRFWPNRSAVLIRDAALERFTLFEERLERFQRDDFEWTKNAQGNLAGRDRNTGDHRFTWQFHGAQFTVHAPVPASAVRFSLRRPEPLDLESVLRAMDYSETWTTIHQH